MVVGLNYKTAPVEIREKLTFQGSDLEKAMRALKDCNSILENVIVSTCNRTEIYAVVDQLPRGRYYVKQFLSEWFQLPVEEFSPYLRIHEEEGAVDHLFHVACGLRSMVVGETQILGQVKSSFLLGQELGTTGTIFNMLFKQAVTVGKRAHSETEIGENAVSVSYAAVQLAKKIFGSLRNCNVLIIGAGKMGELALQNLYGNGVNKVTVLNRTYEKAQSMASKYEGDAKSLNELQCALVETDIVISSTGAKEYVITKDMMEHVEKMRRGRPLFMVDIAVPRDLDPSIHELDNVFLYDIDDLEGIVEANVEERTREAEKIDIMIEEEMLQFKKWLSTLEVVPVIAALRDKATAIQEETLQSLERKLPSLTERERKIINKLTKSIVNQMLRDPILKAKEMANEPMAKEKLMLFKEIFNIEQEIETKQQETAKEVWNANKTAQNAML
nr:glutamyl-tRNA reductase [Priestia taiwanensis]